MPLGLVCVTSEPFGRRALWGAGLKCTFFPRSQLGAPNAAGIPYVHVGEGWVWVPLCEGTRRVRMWFVLGVGLREERLLNTHIYSSGFFTFSTFKKSAAVLILSC